MVGDDKITIAGIGAAIGSSLQEDGDQARAYQENQSAFIQDITSS